MLGPGDVSSTVSFDGSDRIETCPNSQHYLEQALFCQSDRAIDVVDHGLVGGVLQVAA